jgi:putative restriction endonuclease
MSLRDAYREYVYETNRPGSNKADSYLHALDYLGPILAANSKDFKQCADLWQEDSPKLIFALYKYILEQQRLGSDGIFSDSYKPSYWRSGFYSAALNSYSQFLVEFRYGKSLSAVYDEPGIQSFTSDHFEKPIEDIEVLQQAYPDKKGEDVVRETKERVNQQVFRRKILAIYRNECCITGLDIPQVNRASHIIGWAEDEKYRLDPTNGLCLSATYDAAFDKHLISLDEDYRLILSPNLRDHYTKNIVQQYFHRLEGRKITLPSTFMPSQEHLEVHREKLNQLSRTSSKVSPSYT